MSGVFRISEWRVVNTWTRNLHDRDRGIRWLASGSRKFRRWEFTFDLLGSKMPAKGRDRTSGSITFPFSAFAKFFVRNFSTIFKHCLTRSILASIVNFLVSIWDGTSLILTEKHVVGRLIGTRNGILMTPSKRNSIDILVENRVERLMLDWLKFVLFFL